MGLDWASRQALRAAAGVKLPRRDKIGWVLLPIALCAAVLAWLAWRGRMPSRQTLNVASSLLLLASEVIALPPPRARPLPHASERLELTTIGVLLWHTAGVSAVRGGLYLRTAPSSDALFASELYLVARRVGGLAPGLWHYAPQHHALALLQRGAADAAALGLPHAVREADAVLVATALFRRSGHKYGDRTYRFVLADLGHALENLRVAPAAPSSADRLEVIAQALPLADLAAVLDAMSAPPPQLSHAVRIHVLTPLVQGLAPRAWRWQAAGRRLRPATEATAGLHRRARAAALDQDVVGDAAVVFVLTIDRGAFAADPAGAARGYRHALLEAGLVGERVYLEAGSRGLGVCAVGAFYDDEAAELIAIDPAREWPLHFVALGLPG